MTMCTYKKICITNRKLVTGDFLGQIERVAERGIDAVILREKDLPEEEYERLAEKVLAVCERYGIQCILHSFINVAKRLDHPYIHLPMPLFLDLEGKEKAYFQRIGVSTHTVEEAKLAEKLGADYITASHIFTTECKIGMEPRGLDYLRKVVNAVDIEVYALGGIHPDNVLLCVEAGADGICMMSEYMKGKEF